MIHKDDKVVTDSNVQSHKCKGMNLNTLPCTSMDMYAILSEMTVKVPLSELFKIEEHTNRAMAWIIKVGLKVVEGSKNLVNDKESPSQKSKDCEGVVSQIPPMYLETTPTPYIEDIDPFFLSLVVNGKVLKNCMIDSGASNTVMPFKIVEALGLKVGTKKGRCCALDFREVPIIGMISAMPYKLATYPDHDLAMSVLVVDIPPRYGMLLSRKWSVAMGGSL